MQANEGHSLQAVALVGEFNNWEPLEEHWATKNDFGVWALFLADTADGASAIPHRQAQTWATRAADGTLLHRAVEHAPLVIAGSDSLTPAAGCQNCVCFQADCSGTVNSCCSAMSSHHMRSTCSASVMCVLERLLMGRLPCTGAW